VWGRKSEKLGSHLPQNRALVKNGSVAASAGLPRFWAAAGWRGMRPAGRAAASAAAKTPLLHESAGQPQFRTRSAPVIVIKPPIVVRGCWNDEISLSKLSRPHGIGVFANVNQAIETRAKSRAKNGFKFEVSAARRRHRPCPGQKLNLDMMTR
jgi:hypothetical protein